MFECSYTRSKSFPNNKMKVRKIDNAKVIIIVVILRNIPFQSLTPEKPINPKKNVPTLIHKTIDCHRKITNNSRQIIDEKNDHLLIWVHLLSFSTSC